MPDFRRRPISAAVSGKVSGSLPEIFRKIRSEKNDWKDEGFFRVTDSRTLTGLTAGTSYIAFYVPATNQQYTIIFGYHVTVDALGQISVEVAESDSQLGQESQE